MSDKKPVSLLFAIPDHPWVDSADGAAVRISMTVAIPGEQEGILRLVTGEFPNENDEVKIELSEKRGQIFSDLKIGADITRAISLRATEKIGNRGVQLIGTGFIVTQDQAQGLGLGKIIGLEKYIRRYRNGKDIMGVSRDVMVIDLFGLTEKEVRTQFSEVYQWVLERVKPSRDQNNRASYREKWWGFGEPVKTTRDAIAGLKRYIVTCRTAKHRVFTFVDADIVPDAKLITIALEDSCYLGVLSSHIHVLWATASGAWLGVGNDSNYNHSECFNKFPFPDLTNTQKDRIRELAEQLDNHRMRQQALHPKLTMTDMYNVLEKLRAGEELTTKDKTTHEQGLVSILKQLHDDLDAAVFDAYGWDPAMTDDEILAKLVDLNAERAAEEAQGLIRWLRPEYQAPAATTPKPTQTSFIEAEEDEGGETTPIPAVKEKQPWPKSMAEQAQAVRAALQSLAGPATARQVAVTFKGARQARVEELLETLVLLGQVREIEEDKYIGQ